MHHSSRTPPAVFVKFSWSNSVAALAQLTIVRFPLPCWKRVTSCKNQPSATNHHFQVHREKKVSFFHPNLEVKKNGKIKNFLL